MSPSQFTNGLQAEVGELRKQLIEKSREVDRLRAERERLPDFKDDEADEAFSPDQPLVGRYLSEKMPRRQSETALVESNGFKKKEDGRKGDSRTRNTEGEVQTSRDSARSEGTPEVVRELRSKLIRFSHAYFLLKTQNEELVRQNERLLDSVKAQGCTAKRTEEALKAYRERLRELGFERAIYRAVLAGNKDRLDQLRLTVQRQTSPTGRQNQFSFPEAKSHLTKMRQVLDQIGINRVRESLKIMDVEVDDSEIQKIEVPLLSRSRSAHTKDDFLRDLELSCVLPDLDDRRRSSTERRTIKSYEFGELI